MSPNIDWTTLYSSQSGNDIIDLPDNIYNYNRIYIFYRLSEMAEGKEIRLDPLITTAIPISLIWAHQTGAIIASKRFSISSDGRKLTADSSRSKEIELSSSGVVVGTANRLIITKIIGLR